MNETVTLVVAELTADAVTHGRVPGRDFRLSLTLTAAHDLVRIEVTDTRNGGSVLVQPYAPQDLEAEESRSLWLVSRLASRLSVEPRTEGGPGRTVRAELVLCGEVPVIDKVPE